MGLLQLCAPRNVSMPFISLAMTLLSAYGNQLIGAKDG